MLMCFSCAKNINAHDLYIKYDKLSQWCGEACDCYTDEEVCSYHVWLSEALMNCHQLTDILVKPMQKNTFFVRVIHLITIQYCHMKRIQINNV